MFKELINEAIESLRNHPLVEMNELVINDPATPELIDSFEMITGIRLPENIKTFYSFANGLKCVWSVKQNLPAATMDKIRAEGEQKDFDYTKPLGAVNILPVQDMLLDKYWKPPFQEDPEAVKIIQFNNQDFQQGDFARKLKIFDAYFLNNDEECMALLTNLPVNGTDFHLLLLDESSSDWQQSNIIDFDTYIECICETRFTIPSRKRLFSKKQTDKAILILDENLDKAQLVPVLFR